MLIIILAILMLQFTGTAVAAPPAVVSVQSIDVPPYNEALRGFQSICNADTEKNHSLRIGPCRHRPKNYQRPPPDLIVAIGPDALQKIKTIANTPIVYLMILNPGQMAADAPNITGVSMNIAQKKTISDYSIRVTECLPHRIGV